MRYGVVILPEHSWSRAAETWRRAEEFGFSHAWTYDHIRWRWLAEKPWFGAIPTLVAAAAVTSRIHLGTLVASPGLRHPITFAKEMMSLDDISGGRAICGIGAGGYDADTLQGPLTKAESATRFAEFVELTDNLLRQQPTILDGAFFQSKGVVMHPGCIQRPRLPLAVAATGPRGMRLAARYADTWVTSGAPGQFNPAPYESVLPLIRAQLDALDEACDRTGRDPTTLNRLLLTGASVGGVLDSIEAFRDATESFAAIGVTDIVVHWPRESFPYKGNIEILERIADSVLLRSDGVRRR